MYSCNVVYSKREGDKEFPQCRVSFTVPRFLALSNIKL